MLLPALAAARERARRLACQNNLHLIGFALDAYAADYGRYPSANLASPPDADPPPQQARSYCLVPYVLIKKGYLPWRAAHCPSTSWGAKYRYNAPPETGECRADPESTSPQWLATCMSEASRGLGKDKEYLKFDVLRLDKEPNVWAHGDARQVLYTDGKVVKEVRPVVR